jgi:hypothetical protein
VLAEAGRHPELQHNGNSHAAAAQLHLPKCYKNTLREGLCSCTTSGVECTGWLA